MGIKLIEPGKRKGNKFWLLRAYVGDKEIELSTKATTKAGASKFREDFERELEKTPASAPGRSAEITFAEGADLYTAWRSPSKVDKQRIEKLKLSDLGKLAVRAIAHADLVAAANDLYPDCKASTKNRNAIRPAASILHYCAENKYCDWLRVKTFKEPHPVTRAVSIEAAIALVSNVPMAVDRKGKLLHQPPAMIGNRQSTQKDLDRFERRLRKKRLLLTWLFRQGMRITDALSVTWDGIDLARGSLRYHTGKGDREIVDKALHEEVIELLAATPKLERTGRLFPWRTRWGVYKWLRPYVQSLGLAFTPHMARHSVGTWLAESQANQRTIMDTLDHLDMHSSARYQSTGIEVIRAASERMPTLRSGGGKTGIG